MKVYKVVVMKLLNLFGCDEELECIMNKINNFIDDTGVNGVGIDGKGVCTIF